MPAPDIVNNNEIINSTQATTSTGSKTKWETYTNTDEPHFTIQYPSTWERRGELAGMNFSGPEGWIEITFGDGFGGGYCTDPDNLGLKIEDYSIKSQGLSGCKTTKPNGTIQTMLFRQFRPGVSIKIESGANSSTDAVKLENILATFEFTK